MSKISVNWVCIECWESGHVRIDEQASTRYIWDKVIKQHRKYNKECNNDDLFVIMNWESVIDKLNII